MSSSVYEQAFIIRPQPELLQQHPELKHAGNALVRKYAFHELVTEEELQRIGQGLWQTLDQTDEFEQALRRAGVQILPIILESDDAAIQQLPWETLYHPEHGFLGKSARCALSRHIPASAASPSDSESGPLRVLLFTSLPDDLEAESGRLDVEEEQTQVQEALMPWIAKGLAQLEMPDDYDTALDYLKQSLAIRQEIGDKSGASTTLNNMSQIYDARGDYDTALDYLKQALAIQQEIGDIAGLCATLFNMGHIHHQNEETPQALQAWVTVYRLAKPINLAQALDALENLAGQLGLPGGLEGWERLAQQMDEA